MVKPIVWTIAGSDSGGGAGIQADLHTIAALGAHGCSVITAVTAQNSVAVNAVEPVANTLLQSQLQTLADDLLPQVIKIGLLANCEQVTLVADTLRQLRCQCRNIKVIYDPVAAASTGSGLTSEPITDTVKRQLLPLLDLITPNALEVEQFTGIPIVNYHSLQLSTDVLRQMGVRSVAIKGGHSELVAGHCIDYLRSDDFESDALEMVLAQPRLDNPHSHGSGCCFASAIAAALARGYSLEDAVLLANAYVHRGLRNGHALGAGPGSVAHGGWPEVAENFPEVILPGSSVAAQLGWQEENQLSIGFASCDTQQLGLYPVVDSCDWLEKLLKQGVKTLQLRVKNLPEVELRHQLVQAIERGREHNARLFINDHWRLAIELGAYGVHLGQEDMERADLRAIRQAGLRLGLSTHGYFELLRALAIQPSYVACGAIYATTTKTMPSKPQGLEKLRRYLKLTGDSPVVAIGGISTERAPKVAATGVGSIAVVTAITEANDYRQAVKALTEIVGGGLLQACEQV